MRIQAMDEPKIPEPGGKPEIDPFSLRKRSHGGDPRALLGRAALAGLVFLARTLGRAMGKRNYPG